MEWISVDKKLPLPYVEVEVKDDTEEWESYMYPNTRRQEWKLNKTPKFWRYKTEETKPPKP